MRIITLWEPWATLMALGEKRIETRTWKTSYRGLLAIHAASVIPPEGKVALATEPFVQALRGHTLSPGTITCIVDLYDCVPVADLYSGKLAINFGRFEHHFGKYEPGRYAWLTRDLKRLECPLYYKGSQGLRKLPDITADYIKQRRFL